MLISIEALLIYLIATDALLCFDVQALSHYREKGQAFPERDTIEKLWLACDRGDPEVSPRPHMLTPRGGMV
jgi:hypothetical protein